MAKSTTEAPDRAWWEGREAPRPRRRGVARSAHYVKVRDGTNLALDLFLPGDLRSGEQVPTIITATPYMRAVEFRNRLSRKIARRLAFLGTEEFAEQCVSLGYAYVLLDLRGSGASFGRRTTRAHEDAKRDGSDVIDWIVAQPWSNGRVGTSGVSGHGLAAMWIALSGNPALHAVSPRFTAFDNFTSTHPGGALANRFNVDIDKMVNAIDNNELWKMPDNWAAQLLLRLLVRGVKPVDEDRDRSLLAAAVRDHAANESAAQQIAGIDYREDVAANTPGTTVDDWSLISMVDEIRRAGVPIYCEGGFMDAAFARELLSLHNTVGVGISGSRITIGPWGHGGKFYSSPVATKRTPTAFDHAAELIRFFDAYLRDDTRAPSEDPIWYYAMGEERWRSTTVWPVPSTMTAWHLAAHGRLVTEPGDAAGGADRMKVDFTHGTGVHSRFGKHLTTEMYPVAYPDRAARDRKLLVYDSELLPGDYQVTGHPVAHLFVSSSADDGLVIVYLEDVDPNGAVRVVADGWLRARHRGTTSPAPYWVPAMYRAFTRAESSPLVPGEVTHIAFDLYPTSWLFRRGHRIRVAIAGADKDNLDPVAEAQQPVLSVHRGPDHLSRLDLPVVNGSPS